VNAYTAPPLVFFGSNLMASLTFSPRNIRPIQAIVVGSGIACVPHTTCAQFPCSQDLFKLCGSVPFNFRLFVLNLPRPGTWPACYLSSGTTHCVTLPSRSRIGVLVQQGTCSVLLASSPPADFSYPGLHLLRSDPYSPAIGRQSDFFPWPPRNHHGPNPLKFLQYLVFFLFSPLF